MTQAFRGDRLRIAILGRCNTGKSSILNRITGQQAAIVSPQPGTTGDPVPLPFELLPLGPVTFYDTAGLDETSDLGALRREAGRKILALADMALIVTDEQGLGAWERELIAALRALETPLLLVFNKADIRPVSAEDTAWCADQGIAWLSVTAVGNADPAPLRQAVIALAPAPEAPPTIVADLLPPRGTVVCVTPVDASAPKGRLIAPQVQVLRELAERHHVAVVAQTEELPLVLERLRQSPDLVITDSQAVKAVVGLLPAAVPLTTFSLLFARLKGDFALQLAGASAVDTLKEGDAILMAEACSHHPQEEDIARVKIPALIRACTGHAPRIDVCSGGDFPADLGGYALAVHCGGCMLNRAEMRRRLRLCATAGLPVTNFGMVLAHTQGVLERVAAPLRNQ